MWQNADATYKRHTKLHVHAVQADRESEGILHRLSHITINCLAKTVAKLAYSNLCIFSTNVVTQIIAYDNLASVVIQALCYVTNMGCSLGDKAAAQGCYRGSGSRPYLDAIYI